MPARLARAALAAALLAGCAQTSSVPVPASRPAGPAVCRIGPDGGPPPGSFADKGIGGTGGPALADRGIGGTGIIAVITGFASVCLGGEEVALSAETPVQLGPIPAEASALRVGQVAVVEASGAETALRARRIAIRYEVSGPVEAVAPGQIRVAGQIVLVTTETIGAKPALGDWVAVSGLRPDPSTIVATRIDRRAAGPVSVIGVLNRDAGGLRIGMLPVEASPILTGLVGQSVMITGPLLLGALQPETAAPDLLATDPAAYFGPAVGTLVVEVYAGGGRSPRFEQDDLHRSIFRLEREGGRFRGIGAPAPGASATGSRAFAPAPMPDRSFRGTAGFGGSGQPFERGRFGQMRQGSGQPGAIDGPGDRGGPRSR